MHTRVRKLKIPSQISCTSFLSPPLRRRFLVFCQLSVISASVPPGNAQKHFPSLLQVGWYLQTAPGISDALTSFPNTPFIQTSSVVLCFREELFIALSSICNPSDFHASRADEMVCSTYDLIQLKAILASMVQSWRADVLVVNRWRHFPLFLLY